MTFYETIHWRETRDDENYHLVDFWAKMLPRMQWIALITFIEKRGPTTCEKMKKVDRTNRRQWLTIFRDNTPLNTLHYHNLQENPSLKRDESWSKPLVQPTKRASSRSNNIWRYSSTLFSNPPSRICFQIKTPRIITLIPASSATTQPLRHPESCSTSKLSVTQRTKFQQKGKEIPT